MVGDIKESQGEDMFEQLIFDCSTIEEFTAGVSKYCMKYSVTFNHNNDEPIDDNSAKDMFNAFRLLLQKLRSGNEAERMKCVVFDNAEPNEGDIGGIYVLKCIEDWILRPMKNNDVERAKWRIFVTTCKSPGEWLDCCRNIDEEDFFEVKEFDMSQTKSLLNRLELSQDSIRSLHDAVGGLPCALKDIKDILKKSKVSISLGNALI